MIGELLELRRLLRTPRLAPDEWARLRDEKLRAVVRHAHDRVPYYRQLFRAARLSPDDIRTTADLARLPVTTKDDLRRAGAAAVVDDPAALRDRATVLTSGTSGEPFTIVSTRRELARRRLVDFRAMLSAGVTWRDVIAIVGPEHERRARAHDRLGWFRTEIVPGALPPDEQIRRLQRLSPTVLWAYPTVLRAILQRVGYRLHDVCRPRMLITSSEVFDPVLRDRLAAVAQMPTFNFYGTNEVGRIAQECPAHDGLHVNADRVVFELADAQGRRVDGEGSVVVTSLDAYAMPFLRYRVGDLCAPLAGTCRCGSTFPRIAAPTGREWDMVTLPSGRLLSPVAFQVVLRGFGGIDQYRMLQEAPDRIVVTIVPGKSFATDSLPLLEERLLASLGERLGLEIRLSEFMPAGGRKFKVFESRIGRGAG